MKRLAILTLISTPAFGHLVPYDSKAFLDIAKGNPEKANYIAHFCSLAADSVDECLERLIVAKGEDAAEKCGREIKEISDDVIARMHLIGAIKGIPLSGNVHLVNKYTKEEGNHKYGFTEDARKLGGMAGAAVFLEDARRKAEVIQTTKGETQESSGATEGVVKGTAKGPGGIFGGEVSVGHTSGDKDTTGKTTTYGALTSQQIAKAHNEGFKDGWANPFRFGVTPDIFCSDKENGCTAGDSSKIKMSDDLSIVPPVPKTLLEDEGPATVDSKKGDDKPQPPSSPTPSFEQPKDLLKSGASTDSSTPFWSWALIAPAQSGDLIPIQACYEIEMAKTKKKEMIQTVEGDELTYTQRKQRAEESLSMGVCDESFFGQEFCRDWKQKQKLHIDETLSTPSVAVEEQPFEEFATIEEPAEPLKDPFAPLEGSDPFSPIPAEGCVHDCPIEGAHSRVFDRQFPL